MTMSIPDSNQTPKKVEPNAAKQKVSGVMLIDKPMGMTSQQVVSKVKYLFKSPVHDSKKAGHTGTLDPMATGLLPICLGEATKFSHYQLDADKAYQATILLGSQTDTGDAEGQVIANQPVPAMTQAALEAVTEQFLGAQQQIPPMYSALKKEGKKLYEYARAGIEVERPARDITIKALELQSISAEQLQLTVTCSKGTYVRVLGEDIAKALGTLGHLTVLRRIQVGKFDGESAITIAQLEALNLSDRLSMLLPVDACIDICAELTLGSTQCDRLRQGQRLNVREQFDDALESYLLHQVTAATGNDDTLIVHEYPVDIRLLDEQGQFIGLGALSLNGRLQPKKLIHL